MLLNNLAEIPFLHHLVNGTIGAEDALEKYDFIDILVDVRFLLDGLHHLLKILLLAEVFNAAEGEMRDEILPVAEVSDAVEGGEDVFFEAQELFRRLLHAEP